MRSTDVVPGLLLSWCGYGGLPTIWSDLISDDAVVYTTKPNDLFLVLSPVADVKGYALVLINDIAGYVSLSYLMRTK